MNSKESRIAKKKILVVDDEPEVCSLLCDFLNMRGFEVGVAYNGQEALDRVAKAKPDLITLDVIMPVMDGFELLRYLKSRNDYSGIPVIMLTAKKAPKDLDRGISLKADFYLPKPFTFDNLMDFINLVLV